MRSKEKARLVYEQKTIRDKERRVKKLAALNGWSPEWGRQLYHFEEDFGTKAKHAKYKQAIPSLIRKSDES